MLVVKHKEQTFLVFIDKQNLVETINGYYAFVDKSDIIPFKKGGLVFNSTYKQVETIIGFVEPYSNSDICLTTSSGTCYKVKDGIFPVVITDYPYHNEILNIHLYDLPNFPIIYCIETGCLITKDNDEFYSELSLTIHETLVCKYKLQISLTELRSLLYDHYVEPEKVKNIATELISKEFPFLKGTHFF